MRKGHVYQDAETAPYIACAARTDNRTRAARTIRRRNAVAQWSAYDTRPDLDGAAVNHLTKWLVAIGLTLTASVAGAQSLDAARAAVDRADALFMQRSLKTSATFLDTSPSPALNPTVMPNGDALSPLK